MHERVLVLYASTHGHTGKIAERVGALLRERGISVRCREVGQASGLDLGEFDGVVVGASVHGGHFQKAMVEWLSEHHTRLGLRPSAFFSVSLSAADDTEEARELVKQRIDDLLEATGWIPTLTRSFAGALQFKEYNLPTRVIMRLIARRIEHETGTEVDVHQDTDYTDWAAVETFAQDFVGALQRAEVAS